MYHSLIGVQGIIPCLPCLYKVGANGYAVARRLEKRRFPAVRAVRNHVLPGRADQAPDRNHGAFQPLLTFNRMRLV